LKTDDPPHPISMYFDLDITTDSLLRPL